MSHIDRDIDLNLFRVLDALHTHGGTSSAAKALHLTQSAVSHSLARLRDLFGDPLFVRQGNRMVPTERTRQIMPEVQRNLRGLLGTVSAREQFRPDRLNAKFQLGVRDASEAIIFPALAERLGREAPDVRVVSRNIVPDRLESELVAGTLDLAIDRSVKTSERICRVKLVSEPWAVVAPAGRTSLTARQYAQSKHVHVAQLEGEEPVDDALAKQGLRRDVPLRCHQYLSACNVVLATNWLLSMPQSYARHLARLMPLSVLPLPLEVPPMDIFMYWHTVHDAAPEHVWFRRMLVEAAVVGLALPVKASPTSRRRS
jgi:DNA-binding transcriptional LysR family regulator